MRFVQKLKSRSTRKKAEEFGDLFIFDHVYMKDSFGQPGIGGAEEILIGYDDGTDTWYAEPSESKESLDTFTTLNQIEGNDQINYVYSDDYPSYLGAIMLLRAKWERSQPGIDPTMVKIEHKNGTLLGDTRTNLVQAGLPTCFLGLRYA